VAENSGSAKKNSKSGVSRQEKKSSEAKSVQQSS
jgi:hypothetical protein